MDGDGGQIGGSLGGQLRGTTQDGGGATGQAPDFDGDGEPDTISGPEVVSRNVSAPSLTRVVVTLQSPP
jgi:hypothetical protein